MYSNSIQPICSKKASIEAAKSLYKKQETMKQTETATWLIPIPIHHHIHIHIQFNPMT